MKICSVAEIAKNNILNNERIQEMILKEKWIELFPDLKKNSSVNYIKNKILYLKVEDSIVKHYIYMNKNKILKKILENIDFIIENIQIEIK